MQIKYNSYYIVEYKYYTNTVFIILMTTKYIIK